MGAFSLHFLIYIIDFITRARLRLAIELPCLVSLSSVTVLGFLLCFVWMRRNQSFNIASETTGIEDTYQTITAIPF